MLAKFIVLIFLTIPLAAGITAPLRVPSTEIPSYTGPGEIQYLIDAHWIEKNSFGDVSYHQKNLKTIKITVDKPFINLPEVKLPGNIALTPVKVVMESVYLSVGINHGDFYYKVFEDIYLNECEKLLDSI